MGRFRKAIATMLVACMTMVTPASLGMTKVSAIRKTQLLKKEGL